MEELHKTTTDLKKAYAEIILNTAKESAARVMLSDRKSARFHHDLSETKEEALRLLVRLKHMIDAKTIEADVISSNQQRKIDVLEAQLHEAEDIITDLRSEVRWVRDRLEKAKAFESQELDLVNMEEEEETVSVHKAVVVESLNPDQEHDVECENDEKQFDALSVVDTLHACESQEGNVVSQEEETVSVHKVESEVVLESVKPDQVDRSSCENDENWEKAKASESQERNLVNMEEERVSAHKVEPEVVVENVNTDHSSARDVECENDIHLEKEKASESQEQNIVNKEEDTVSAHKVVVESLKPNQEVADTCFSHENHFDGLSVVVDTVMGNDVCESELVGDIRIKKLELSRNGCTQRIHALERVVLERQSSSSADEEGTTEKDSEENLSSSGKAGTLENKRCLVLALRASSAEVVTVPSLGFKKTSKARKLRGRRKRRFGKPKAKSVRSQSQLIKPCQSQSNVTSSKTSTSDGEDSIESEEVDDLKTCKELKEHLQLKRTLESGDISIDRKGKKSKNMHVTGNFVEACQESNLVSINVEDADIPEKETKIKPLPRLRSRKEDALVDVLISCEGEEDSVIPSTKTASSLVNLRSDWKVNSVVVSDQIGESPPRANVNRLLKYTFQRKRKRGSANINDDSNNLPWKHQENQAQDQIETTSSK